MIQAASDDSGFFGALHDFFGSGTWPVARNLGIFLVVVFWLAVGYWVFKDARRRIEDPWLVGAATVLGLVPPFIGAFIYMLFRPPEYLEDVRERELEIKAMEESLGTAERCPVCRAVVEPTFLACPVCTTKLKEACRRCKAPLEPLWQVCPYCETPVESPRAVENL
jgi:RNA polymerase subunit RPABC4/transcription elongation factor Spt4